MRASVPAAILLAGAFIAASIALSSHWSIAPLGAGRVGAYRLNHWTGEVVWCWHAGMQAPDRVECTATEWISVPNQK
jgi:hypothetical protein